MCDYTKESREPKEHRLFHYTRKPEHLEDMIQNGLWPRYCEEDFEWLIGQRQTLAFPLVCFCDIPLDAARAHRVRYGDYALGFSKDLINKLDINPIWYVHEDSSIGKRLAARLAMEPRFDLAKLDGFFVRDLLPFVKSTNGTQLDRAAIREGTFEAFAFEEEMEWRHTPAALVNQWFQSGESGFVTEEDHHALSKEHRLKLPFDDIDCVFVPRHDDARDLSKKFPDLRDKIEIW